MMKWQKNNEQKKDFEYRWFGKLQISERRYAIWLNFNKQSIKGVNLRTTIYLAIIKAETKIVFRGENSQILLQQKVQKGINLTGVIMKHF